ncbi:MAG: transporter [Elusimicrobia bacterium GWA2_64_40]|nr:MAG: transporter [Elusimicrobia bacterium GWA2_64_40]
MSLAELSIKRPIFITCLVLLMLVVGWTCFKRLPVEKMPDTSFPTITVTTRYTGAGPSEIETLVTKPLEDELSTISGLKRVTSKSMEGVSQITVEFNFGSDVNLMSEKMRDKINTVKATLPADVKDPTLSLMDPANMPILKLVVSADLPESKLYDVAEYTIKPALEQVNNVGSVKLTGGRKREIQVVLDRAALKKRELSVSGVASSLSASGENVPGGKVNRGGQEITYRSMGEFASVKEIANTVLGLYGNEVATRVSDIGKVYDTVQDETTRVFVDGKKSLFIQIYRQSGANTIGVADDVKKKLEALKPALEALDGKPRISVLQDSSTDIKDNITDVEETIFIGILLTIVVVYFFLANGRSTIITALALPNSLIGAFILMAVAGFSLNIISLLALSLAVGLLIDDAIVVRENIFRKMEQGETPEEAAVNGTKEVQLAVIATTLVVLSVFAPIALVSGMVGMLMKQFGLTICFAMLISLFDALTIAPMLSAYLGKSGRAGGEDKPSLWARVMAKPLGWFESLNTALANGYERLLRWVVVHPLKTLAVSGAVFLLCMSSFTKVAINFMPDSDTGQFGVDMELSPGASLDAMQAVADKAVAIVRASPEVKLTALTVGGTNDEAYKASLYIQLKDPSERKATTKEMKSRLRAQLEPAIPEASPLVSDYDPTGSSKSQPLQLNLIGTDQAALNAYAEKVIIKLKQDKRLRDIDTNYRPGKPELQIKADLEKAKIYGVNTRTIGEEIRAQVEGVTPVKFRENGQEYDVRVRLQPEQRDLASNYQAIYVPNVNGRLVRLTDVAAATSEKGLATVERVDKGRYIQIKANLAPKVGLNDVVSSVKQLFAGELQPPKGIRWVFVGESENMQDMISSMVMAVGFGILFIFFVLASLYESFVTPFTIMLALPLAMCGAFVALLVTGASFSIFTAMGLIMLLGIACKNSILLVDYTARLIAEGKDRTEAIIEAGKIRLRPILMTSIALIAGMIPVAIGLNEASKQRTSMGVAVIGGLISSTLLTLIVVPAVFAYVDRFRIWSGGVLARLAGYRSGPEA